MNKDELISTFIEDDHKFETLGRIVWWSISCVDITRDKLMEVLDACGINRKFARQHSYRSAVIRSLRDMEEQRIIRLVEEDHHKLVYQFTAEIKIEDTSSIPALADGEKQRLAYDPETVIVFDKDKYRQTQNVIECLSGRTDIVEKLIGLFNDNKDHYYSSDITRMLQRIFTEKADIVTLRQQGGVYFVPAMFTDIVEAVAQFMNSIGGGKFEYIPLPNVEACRKLVKDAVENEMMIDLAKMDKEIEAMEKGEIEKTDKWVTHRVNVIQNLRNRVERYMSVLGEESNKMIKTGLERIEKLITTTRQLDLA